MGVRLKDIVNHFPGVGTLVDIEKYAQGEIGDATLFGAYAVAAGYEIGNAAARHELRKLAAKWVLEHGTPTPGRVKGALGL